MKLIRKYAGFLLMLTLLVGFTSCEDDETIFDHIVGRTWVGDSVTPSASYHASFLRKS